MQIYANEPLSIRFSSSLVSGCSRSIYFLQNPVGIEIFQLHPALPRFLQFVQPIDVERFLQLTFSFSFWRGAVQLDRWLVTGAAAAAAVGWQHRRRPPTPPSAADATGASPMPPTSPGARRIFRPAVNVTTSPTSTASVAVRRRRRRCVTSTSDGSRQLIGPWADADRPTPFHFQPTPTSISSPNWRLLRRLFDPSPSSCHSSVIFESFEWHFGVILISFSLHFYVILVSF